MSDPKVTSLTIEVQEGSLRSTVVVHDPDQPGARVFIAGDLPREVVMQVLARLGIESKGKLAAGAPSFVPDSVPPVSFADSSLEVSSVRSTARGTRSPSQALEDLFECILRVGRRHPTTSVEDALIAARSVARGSAALNRLLVRVERALQPETPADTAAFALAALGTAARRCRDPDDAWTREAFPTGHVSAPDASEYLEIGRSTERGAVGCQTRLLLDFPTGKLFRETGEIGAESLSRGPVGRRLTVTLAERFTGFDPERLVVRHYEYEPSASATDLDLALSHAAGDLPPSGELGLSLALTPRPVWLAVTPVEDATNAVRVRGRKLALWEGHQRGLLGAFAREIERSSVPAALAGALRLEAEGLVIEPWTALFRRPSGELYLSHLSV